MRRKTLVIGGIAVAALLGGGWALAQAAGHPAGFRRPSMRSEAPDGMGLLMTNGMHRGMGPGMMEGMDHRMGRGMMNGRGGRGPGAMKGVGPGAMLERPGSAFTDATQIETLKRELGITAGQEAVWNKYAKALQEAAAAMKTARDGVDRDAASKMRPAERFAFVSRRREQGHTQFEAVRAAAYGLLAALDEAQKARAVRLPPGLAFGPGLTRTAFTSGHPHKHRGDR